MKKMLSLILAVVMMLALAVSVSAAGTNLDSAGSDEKDVSIKVNPQDPNNTVVYCVDIAWDAMVFEYDFGQEDKWDPEDHAYTGGGGTAKRWINNSSTFTITNHTNAAVKYDVSYDDEGLAQYGVTIKFDQGSSADQTELSDIEIATAVGTEVDEAPTSSFTVKAGGEPTTDNLVATKIGKVVVTIE